MSDFFTIFQPGMEYTQRQRDLDKILIVEADEGAPGPEPLDLESGVVVIDVPGSHGSPQAPARGDAPPAG
ncbi:MAG TPA: DUF6191 domain-containing protein [Arachnia sp.]|nr:DUF6191 domain-containing protein [Arachnia sp.]HMT85328.1 DUF6191 domain-containing protein [Arachnia sp.]